MTIEKLQDTIKPLDEVNKINELVDVCNIPMSYSATNPALTSSSGICTWVVTHNLGSENIFSIVYNSNNSEIFKNTSIDSANQITITFNSTDNIEAGSYRVVVTTGGIGTGSGGGGSYSLPTASTSVLGGVKIDGTSITINGEGVISSTGGTPITIDSTLSATSTNPVQNKVLYPSLSGFLPGGTTITVKTDGTGDFTTLGDAIDYLTGKWSNGEVIISMSADTFTISSRIDIDSYNFNFLLLTIQGTSRTSTILYRNAFSSMYDYVFGVSNYGTPVRIRSLTVKGLRNDSTYANSGLVYHLGGQGIINDVLVQDVTDGYVIADGGRAEITNAYATNCSEGILAQGGTAMINPSTLTLNNIGVGLASRRGGYLSVNWVTKSFTNVQTISNPSINSDPSVSGGLLVGGFTN